MSILIPTHNRPDYVKIALKSAMEQSYENIEIIISDNSDGTATQMVLEEQIGRDARVIYLKQSGGGYMENWLNALSHAHGEYVNFLMDDDLFHPQKIERMLHYYTSYAEIGLVTSFRQLIDAQGALLPSIEGTHPLYDVDTVISGTSLCEFMLKKGQNLVGEPTTVMIRRSDIGASFGQFCGRQYPVLADLATWMELLHGRHCVYISDALSYLRMHDGQDQRKKLTILKANIDWLQLLCDGHEYGKYIVDGDEFRAVLTTKLASFVPFVASQYEDIRNEDVDVEAIQCLIRKSLHLLLQ